MIEPLATRPLTTADLHLLGDDGGTILAYGHHPAGHFADAAAAAWHEWFGEDLLAAAEMDRGEIEAAVDRRWAVAVTPPHPEADWWLRWGGVDVGTPGARAITLLELW